MEALIQAKVKISFGRNHCQVGRISRLLGMLEIEVCIISGTLALPENHPAEAVIITTSSALTESRLLVPVSTAALRLLLPFLLKKSGIR